MSCDVVVLGTVECLADSERSRISVLVEDVLVDGGMCPDENPGSGCSGGQIAQHIACHSLVSGHIASSHIAS